MAVISLFYRPTEPSLKYRSIYNTGHKDEQVKQTLPAKRRWKFTAA
jgi:hypothetical protein